MTRWEYLMIAVSVNAWQQPEPLVAVIDKSGQVSQQHFPEFDRYINTLGEQGWELAGLQDQCWVFKRLKQDHLSSGA